MKSLKKLVTTLTLAVTLGTSGSVLNADACYSNDCCEDYGCGYEDCCNAPSLSPTVALGAVAIIAVIAVVAHNRSSSSSSSSGYWWHGHYYHGHLN